MTLRTCRHDRRYRYRLLRVDVRPLRDGQTTMRLETVCLMCKAAWQGRYRARKRAKLNERAL